MCHLNHTWKLFDFEFAICPPPHRHAVEADKRSRWLSFEAADDATKVLPQSVNVTHERGRTRRLTLRKRCTPRRGVAFSNRKNPKPVEGHLREGSLTNFVLACRQVQRDWEGLAFPSLHLRPARAFSRTSVPSNTHTRLAERRFANYTREAKRIGGRTSHQDVKQNASLTAFVDAAGLKEFRIWA